MWDMELVAVEPEDLPAHSQQQAGVSPCCGKGCNSDVTTAEWHYFQGETSKGPGSAPWDRRARAVAECCGCHWVCVGECSLWCQTFSKGGLCAVGTRGWVMQLAERAWNKWIPKQCQGKTDLTNKPTKNNPSMFILGWEFGFGKGLGKAGLYSAWLFPG